MPTSKTDYTPLDGAILRTLLPLTLVIILLGRTPTGKKFIKKLG